MRKIKPYHAALFMPGFGDRLHVKALAGEVIDVSEPNERDLIAFALDRRKNVFSPERPLPCAGLELDDRLRGIKAVKLGLRRDRILIRRKSPGFDQYLKRSGSADKTKPSEDGRSTVSVFIVTTSVEARPHESCGRIDQKLMVRQPWMARMKMAFDAKPGPILKLLLDQLTGLFGLKAQGISAKVNRRSGLSARRLRKVKALAKPSQPIFAIHFPRKVFRLIVIHGCRHFLTFLPSHSQAVPLRSLSLMSDESPIDSISVPGSSSPERKRIIGPKRDSIGAKCIDQKLKRLWS